MRNRISGIIGVLWGGFILFNHLMNRAPSPTGNAAYNLGRNLGLVFGVLMFAGGLYYLLKGDGQRKKKKKTKSPFRRPT